ncbi:MAG: molybdopterin converting factor subunit 1 [Paracoccaceae bacterium]|nr:molybdopterin converting factor subunit 1 [Paracoccaceae bacterium]MDE2913586.1 molybdopterin converting factor subunit 1 [Paracoccaceae bacterium]
MRLLYFAWIRERIGVPSETVETRARDVAALIRELAGRDDRYALAFSDLAAVRVAVNQRLVELDGSLEDAEEVAFFPPMTGG